MNLEELFPYRVYLNLARRQDRRFAVQGELERAGIGRVERFASVDGKRLGSPRGFGSNGYYALAVTNRMVLRRAALRGAGAVLMFEDDVILHPRFQELAAQIELPEDWEMFFFGCKHVAPPEPAGQGLVRVTRAFDWHAVAFREGAYRKVRRALAGWVERERGGECGAAGPSAQVQERRRTGGTTFFSDRRFLRLPSNDQRVAELQGEGLITYAAWPNLAWQRENASDLVNGTYSAYRPDGEQAVNRENIAGLRERMEAAYGRHGGLVLGSEGGGGALVVRLLGGLGNQMFQYAFGWSLARALGRRLLVCGRGLAGEAVPRRFMLGLYGLEENAPEGVQGRVLQNWGDSPAGLREKYYGALSGDSEGAWELQGYFQNEALFGQDAEEVRGMFYLEPVRLPVPDGGTRVCLQIRRGDFVTTPEHAVCTEGYYLQAMQVMAALVPRAHFIVVSDGIEWCRGFLPQDGSCTFYGSTTEEEDQRVMRGCEAFILSNSTYGWWPAWLTGARHVIRPGRWMNGERAQWSIFPERWMALPCGEAGDFEEEGTEGTESMRGGHGHE